jgi:succinate dehydrogenase/fumarate reductase flavoprotein subunit
MTARQELRHRIADGKADLQLSADVLVIGGSLSGLWAAIAATLAGARVMVAEKGYAGTAGPIAAGSVGSYYIRPDDPLQRDVMVNARMPLAFGLADSRWGELILDQAYRNMLAMSQWGYKWPTTAEGKQKPGGITPNVILFLRRKAEALGVRFLDHSPVLEILLSDGAAAGAAGINRKTGDAWAVRSGAVIIATGGTAFLSGAAGTGGLTGDGYLLGAEAGAEFSGMEFTSQFHIVPSRGVLSKGAYRGNWSTLFDNNGKTINLGRQTVKAILETGAAWDAFDKENDPELQKLILSSNYVSTQFFDDAGIDPFHEKYQVDFICEGSVRATGGLDIDDELSTKVPGLFASGDVTSREKLNGAGPPGGGPAAAWAQGAGYLAGQSAAAFSKRLGPSALTRKAKGTGGAGLRPLQTQRDDIVVKDIVGAVQDHMLALDKNYWRDGSSLEASLAKFGELWHHLRDGLSGSNDTEPRAEARSLLRARETAALLAAARWMNSSALERRETRGLHRRSDYPDLDPNQTHHLNSGGVDQIWVKRRAINPEAIIKEVTAA